MPALVCNTVESCVAWGGLWDVGNRTTLIPAAEGLDTGIQWRMANGEWGCGDRAPLSSPAGAPDLIRAAEGIQWRMPNREWRTGAWVAGSALPPPARLERHRMSSAASTGARRDGRDRPGHDVAGRRNSTPSQSSSLPRAHAPFALPTRHSPMDPVPRPRLAGDDGGGPLPTFHAPLPTIDPFPAFGAALRAPLTRQGRQDRASH